MLVVRRSVVTACCSITDAGTACVVNASNPTATLGGGVSRALFDECGGEVLQAEMRDALAGTPDGAIEMDDCIVTSGGSSAKSRFVLHVASVDYRGVKAKAGADGSVEKAVSSADRVQRATAAALRSAAELAGKLEIDDLSVAFPLLGAGSGGLAPVESMRAMVRGLRAFFRDEPDAPIAKIVFAIPEADRVVLCQQALEAFLVR